MSKHLQTPGSESTFPTGNGYAPKIREGGPKCVVVPLDFTTDAEIDIDFTVIQQAGALSFLQSVFVDNSANTAILTLTFDQTGQVIKVPASSQGVYPVIATISSKCTATTTPGAEIVCKLIGLNMPMPLTQWGPIAVTVNNVTATFTPTVGAWADHNGTTTGGASTALFGANAAAIRRMVMNPSSNIESIFINFGGVAASATEWEIPPGGKFDTETGPIDQTAWKVFSVNGNIPYVAKEMA